MKIIKIWDLLPYFTIAGNHGNTIDGHVIQDQPDGMDKEVMDDRFVQSLTPPCKAVSTDRQYYHLPYEENKPCLHIKLQWQDHRRRLYLSNMLYKLLETLVCYTESLGNYFLFVFQIDEFYNVFFFSKFVSCREKKNQRNVFLWKPWFKGASKLPTGGFANMLLPPYTERYALLRLISLQFQMRDVPIIILFYTITSNAEFGIINKICDVARENDDSKK